MTEIVVGDIGGTHARFAIAAIAAGKVVALGAPVTLRAHDFTSLTSAWEAFARTQQRSLPRAAALGLACPVTGVVLHLTNNPWVLRPANLAAELGLETLVLLNDFAAIGHAAGHMAPEDFLHIAGPDEALPAAGVISVFGPGTGLGVAHVRRRVDGPSIVTACEGGHMDFAALDTLEDAILARLRARFGRVSVERVVSGPGLRNIYEALAGIEGRTVTMIEDAALWSLAIGGTDDLAGAALTRFCLSMGAVAGDLALAQGASAVVIGGGVVPRIAQRLGQSGFAERFCAKGRFTQMMAAMPVKLITHAQPGLLGAAVAFAAEAPKL